MQWEHYVLNELHARLQTRQIRYWRDKRQHEIDFVLAGRGKAPVAIECKWSASGFDPSNMTAFRRLHKQGRNYVVARDVEQSFTQTYQDYQVSFVSLSQLIEEIGSGE